jgi:hypothetical protein
MPIILSDSRSSTDFKRYLRDSFISRDCGDIEKRNVDHTPITNKKFDLTVGTSSYFHVILI